MFTGTSISQLTARSDLCSTSLFLSLENPSLPLGSCCQSLNWFHLFSVQPQISHGTIANCGIMWEFSFSYIGDCEIHMDISKFNLGVKGVQVRAVLTLSVQGCVGQEVAPPSGEVMTTGKLAAVRLGMIGFTSLFLAAQVRPSMEST